MFEVSYKGGAVQYETNEPKDMAWKCDYLSSLATLFPVDISSAPINGLESEEMALRVR